MGASGNICARSLYEDLLCKMSVSRFPHQDLVGPLVEDPLRDYTNATLPAFRAIDTRDLRRGMQFEIRKRNFTCISRTRHALSPQRVHISKPCFRSTAPATKSSAEVIRNAALATQKHPQAQIQKCNPSQELSPSTSKHRIHGADSLRLPRKTQSFE